MAAPTEIGILISVRNKASEPLKRVSKEVKGVREQMVLFNRALFTSAAVYATFTGVLSRGFQMAKIGSEFDFFREQFNKTFGGPEYLTKLRQATQGTMDAMSMMQLAVQNHARGMSKAENEKIFTLSVGAAKLLGTSTAQAAKKMSAAMQSMSVAGMQQFLVALNTNNQFVNMNLILQRLTKGLNSAGMKADVFRRIAMRELEITLGEVSAKGGDARQSMEALSASFTSAKQITGNFLGRGLAPVASFLSRKMWAYFDRLNEILSDTTGKFTSMREGLISFAQSAGMFLGVGATLFGSFTLLTFASSALGLPLTGIAGALLVVASAIKAVAGPSKGWLEILSDTGMILKFLWQSFISYSNGVSTYSSDVVEFVRGMSENGQSWLFNLGKTVVWLKELFQGFASGVKSTISTVETVLSKLGFSLGDVKQFGATNIGENIGKLAGIAATFGAFFVGIKTLKGIGSTLFGSLGGFGKSGEPKGTESDPIYTRAVNGIADKLGTGAFGLAPAIAGAARLLSGVGVAAAGGYAAGTALDQLTGASDKLSSLATSGWKQKLAETSMSGSASKQLGNDDLTSLVGQAMSAGGSFNEIFGDSLKDQFLTGEEMTDVLKRILSVLERGQRTAFPNSKLSSSDQVF